MSDGERNESLLPQFLDSFEEFGRAVALRATSMADAETAPAVRVITESFTESTRQIVELIRRTAEGRDDSAGETIETFLRLTGGVTLVRTATAAIGSPATNARLSLCDILNVLPIIKKLLEGILDALGITDLLPKLIWVILDVLDELIQWLQDLFGCERSGRFHHEMEKRYLTVRRLNQQIARRCADCADES